MAKQRDLWHASGEGALIYHGVPDKNAVSLIRLAGENAITEHGGKWIWYPVWLSPFNDYEPRVRVFYTDGSMEEIGFETRAKANGFARRLAKLLNDSFPAYHDMLVQRAVEGYENLKR